MEPFFLATHKVCGTAAAAAAFAAAADDDDDDDDSSSIAWAALYKHSVVDSQPAEMSGWLHD